MEVFREVRNGLLGDPEEHRDLLDSISHRNDHYLVGADFADYKRAQERADQAFRDREKWTKMSIITALKMGKFSSDRSISQYAEQIWCAH